MLSFNALAEKKTKIKLNPKIQDVQEMDKPRKQVCTPCMGSGQKGGEECTHCEGKGFHMDPEGDMEEGYKGYSKGGEVEPPKERLKTDRNMFNIPKDEQDAARERLKAKAAAKRKQLNKEENAYVSQEEVSEESDQSIDQEETSTLLTFKQFNEGRAEDAKKSLDAVKKRQKVLDAHEKKTGKKLDINKSVEAREHKKNFPGAKRTGKKVKGAKETPAQTQDRRIRQASTRIATKGYTSKEKKEVDSMAKHASRYD